MAQKRTALKFEWETLGHNQELLKKSIQDKVVTFAIGPAGTGKSLVSIYCALDALDLSSKNGGVSQVIVTRPLVTVGQSFGYLPGTLSEKTDPYLQAVFDIIKGSNHPRTQEFLEGNSPHFSGLAVEMMRGMTLSDCLVIVDEAQNLTSQQLEMLLTRIGPNCKMAITGDPSQTDLRKPYESGLMQAVKLLESDPQVGVVRFTVDDVKRSDIVGRIIRAYATSRQK